MIGLFMMDDRDEFALSQIDGIKTIRVRGSDRVKRLVYLDGDQGHDLSDHVYNRLRARPCQLLPAEPGIQALSVCFEDGKPVVDKSPVIAWSLCFDGSIRIVTPAGVDDGHLWKDGWGYVLMPDGSVHAVTEFLDAIRFDDLAGYIRHRAAEVGVTLEEAA